MQRPQLNFSCPEKWNTMSPTGEGRHCDVCDRIVIDFSAKTNDEIISAIKGNSGKACGRFRAVQLKNPFNDRRDRLVRFYQNIAQSSRRYFPKAVLLAFATALLFVSGCRERLTGAYEAYSPKQAKKQEKHEAKQALKNQKRQQQ